jgi:hypothetical protein
VQRIFEYFISGGGPTQASPIGPPAVQHAVELEEHEAVQVELSDDVSIAQLADYIKDQEARIEHLEDELEDSVRRTHSLERVQPTLFSRYPWNLPPELEQPTVPASITPDKEPAVALEQRVITNTEHLKTGELAIDILREVPNATATPHFDPPFSTVPEVEVRIQEFPEGFTGPMIVKTGGTNVDLNVHLSARPHLQTGRYVVEYEAREHVPD